MFKEWADDIRLKTKNMNKEEKWEYIFTYYWYHILIGVVLAGLLILLVYHIGWGERTKEFSLVIVNQEVNQIRDKEIAEGFSEYSGIQTKELLIDSDYLISYDGVKLDGVNESSYEKFFFNWSAGTIDAMIMPESFLEYCKSQDGEIACLEELMDEQKLENLGESLYMSNGQCEGIYVENTILAEKLECSQDDRVILVFPKELHHKEACRQFLDYILQ